MVEATRVGTILAHDRKAWNRWKSRRDRPQKGLTGMALERAIAGIAQMFPGNVIRETA